jgi:trimeric autotransporter adhesin
MQISTKRKGNMKHYLLLILLFYLSVPSLAQTAGIGIGTTSPNSSAILDVKSTTKGLLIPAMTAAQKNAIVNPATGLLIFQTDGSPGFYFNRGTAVSPDWTAIITSVNGWSTSGNSGTDPSSNFIGTTDNQPLVFKTSNIMSGKIDAAASNIFMGYQSGVNAISGVGSPSIFNSFFGNRSGFNTISGYRNTFIGNQSGESNTTGINNTAVGSEALQLNITGGNNTAIGFGALKGNSTGSSNTSLGGGSLENNTTGIRNTALGVFALNTNNTGSYNIAAGFGALRLNTTGSENIAIGHEALRDNPTGRSNVAIGTHALHRMIEGNNTIAIGDSALYNQYYNSLNWYGNTAVGSKAGFTSTSGFHNSYFGYQAGYSTTDGAANCYFGYKAGFSNTNGQGNSYFGGASGATITGGLYNTIIGLGADGSGTHVQNSTAIGFNAVTVGSNSVKLGNTSVDFIGGYSNWTNLSDVRFKTDLREDVKGLDFILQLRPVTYQMNVEQVNALLYKNKQVKDISESERNAMKAKAAIRQTGFVAQEVEAAAKKSGYDFSGVYVPKGDNDHYGLRYAEFVVPLVKAVQEQQKIIQLLQKEIEELKRK